jgi:subtilisin-like proprotein convertase family protein/subtilisin family serine protease
MRSRIRFMMCYVLILTMLGRSCIIVLALTVGIGCLPSFGQAPSAADAALFRFKQPELRAYHVEQPKVSTLAAASKSDWVRAWPANGSTNFLEFGSRIVLQVRAPSELGELIQDRPLRVARQVATGLFILQAPSPAIALRESESLSSLSGVIASYPVSRRQKKLFGPYAPLPTDPYFSRQWHLENRLPTGARAGADLNVRAAWPFARGEGIILALCDDGVDLSHPDLAPNSADGVHFNFVTGTASGYPNSSFQQHGTCVAGLAAGSGYNGLGVSGVAPNARFASWVVFDQSDFLISEEDLMDLFQHASNVVSIQNHSWGNAGAEQLGPLLLERIAISNAITLGRGGKGVIMVRSAGNNRLFQGNVNDDAYPSDPRVIAVTAARFDGRAASYSSPGASTLIAAPSGDDDDDFPTIFTTDRQGALGYNQNTYTNDLADYAFDTFGFSGTSAAAPQIAGLAALILSANTNLTYRDVQQILILSARHEDVTDPDLVPNGAGFQVSHNIGFGIPDAGQAVRLARRWKTRPPLSSITLASRLEQAVPDDGLRLQLEGPGVASRFRDIRVLPSLGPHPDRLLPPVPLIDVGIATNPITRDLRGQAAFIQRGTSLFRDKIQFASDAGALFAVIFNHENGDELIAMGGTDFVPIPAVFISQNDGNAVRQLLRTNNSVQAQLRLDSVAYNFPVTNSLVCEHVGVKLSASHPSRGDLRITLVSPAGTRSVLQHLNSDTTSGPEGWTYYSTHHFYESSAGVWRVFVSDESAGNSGSVTEVDLILYGVEVTDTDHDGLSDGWEMANFGSLQPGPREDPDTDGYSNATEQILESDPRNREDPAPFTVDLSPWNRSLARLSWPSAPTSTYEVLVSPTPIRPSGLATNFPGRFPETEFFLPYTNLVSEFFRVRSRPAQSDQ